MALEHAQFEIRCGVFDPIVIMGSNPNTNVRLAYPSFAPPVGKPDTSLLRTYPCKPAQWDMTFNIHGENVADVYNVLDQLVTILSYAELWRGDNLFYARPYFYFVPKGSTNVNIAYITEVTRLDIPTTLTDASNNFVLNGVRLSCVTTGGYFPETTTLAQVNANQDTLTLLAPLFASFALPDLTVPGLLDIKISGHSASGLDYAHTHYLFINKPGEGSLGISDTPIFVNSVAPTYSALTPEYTLVTDSAANRAPHDVYRFQAPSANTYYLSSFIPLGISTFYPVLKVYALLRANNDVGFTIKLNDPTTGEILPVVSIPYNSGNTQVVYLGAITSPQYANSGLSLDLRLYTAAKSTVGTLDVLKLIAVADQPESTVFNFTDLTSWGLNPSMEIKPRPEIGMPIVGRTRIGYYDPLSHETSPYIFSKGPQVYFYHVALKGTAWRQEDPLRYRYFFNRYDHRLSPR